MHRKLVVLGALALCGHTLASKAPINLEDLKTQDICNAPIVYASLNEVAQPALGKKISDLIVRQDNLFGVGFFKDTGDCSIFLKVSVTVLAIKSGTGDTLGYSFFHNFYLESVMTEIDLANSRKAIVLEPVLYNIGTLFISAENLLESNVLEKTEESFQDFIIDWRKTH